MNCKSRQTEFREYCFTISFNPTGNNEWFFDFKKSERRERGNERRSNLMLQAMKHEVVTKINLDDCANFVNI